ncbi:MAG: bifunctional histidine phosphatase family protein/GNAT family N-acetyltransferase [Oscillibacter sp.]
MTKLYIIRHAEAEGNLYRIAQGQYNSGITDRGQRQIELLARRFADIPVDAVYASDLYRTCATAGAVYLPKGLPLHRRKDLREICVGEWEQKTWGDIARDYPEQLEYFTHQLHLWHAPGAETIEQVRDRVLAAVREIAGANQGKTVAIFSHGCAIRLLLATLQGYSLEDLGETPHGDNTAVSLIQAEGEDLRVIFRDDNTHLGGLSTPGKQANALEPGLHFQPLTGQTAFLEACVSDAWAVSGETRPWQPDCLLKTAQTRPTLVAALGEAPVGILQLHPEKEAEAGCGWISLYCMAPAYRHQGYGVQLLGQAVQAYRPLGRTRLRVALTRSNAAAGRFFGEYGFRAVADAGNRQIWEKNIGYQPEFFT